MLDTEDENYNNDKNKVYLKLNTNIIPYEQEKKIVKIVLRSQHPYADITDDTIKEVNKINKNIRIDLLKSMKSSIIKNNMIIQYAHLKINNTKIAEEYVNTNVLSLSKKYNASPINIIRVVFIHRGLNNKEIRRLFFNSILMNEYDKKQFEIAIKYDNYGFIDEKKILDFSIKFELEIEEILKTHNVLYKTQNQLTDEQYKEGNILCTPDFLILSDLYINNVKVNWIDAKNYYGTYNNFVVKKIKKQTEKYVAGNYTIVVFQNGFKIGEGVALLK